MTRKALLLLCCVLATPVLASQRRADLDASVYNANFIFEGVVTQVVFANSRADTTQSSIPHTFVTYRIERIFKGNATDTHVTLRFLGGKPDADRLMHAAGLPMMDVGDRDILFVRRNGASICPLIACAAGRYRVFDNAILDDTGRAIRLTSSGGVVPGATRNLLAIRQWAAGGIEFRHHQASTQEADAPFEPQASRPWAPVNADVFRNVLQSKVHSMFTPAQLAALPPVNSVSPSVPFDGPAVRPAAPAAGEPQ
ncbi:hypothetical protein ACLESD_33450 [Pyxidicoccus sp. 3LFB2]